MPTTVLALADDLSGAAETAAVLADPARPALVLLGGAPHDTGGPAVSVTGGLVVVDLDCRATTPRIAGRRTAAALAAAGDGVTTFLKIDSLLRGNVAAGVDALAARGPVVVAAALPAAGRTVVDGIVHLHGVALHASTAWAAETAVPPRDVAAALGRPGCPVLDLDAVRGDPAGALAAALDRAPVVVCDATTDADLDRIAGAALASGAALAGSGGAAAALGRVTGRTGLDAGPAAGGHRAVLAVVGSAEPVAARQVGRLLDDGAAEIRLAPGAPAPTRPVRGAPPPADRPHHPGVTVLRPEPGVRGDPAAVAGALAAAAAALAAGPGGPHLVLTGGETARRVLDALDVDRLVPLGQVAHGAVRCRTADGREVVTRPGSFGDDDSLRAMVAAVTAAPPGPPEDLPHPPDNRKVTA